MAAGPIQQRRRHRPIGAERRGGPAFPARPRTAAGVARLDQDRSGLSKNHGKETADGDRTTARQRQRRGRRRAGGARGGGPGPSGADILVAGAARGLSQFHRGGVSPEQHDRAGGTSGAHQSQHTTQRTRSVVQGERSGSESGELLAEALRAGFSLSAKTTP